PQQPTLATPRPGREAARNFTVGTCSSSGRAFACPPPPPRHQFVRVAPLPAPPVGCAGARHARIGKCMPRPLLRAPAAGRGAAMLFGLSTPVAKLLVPGGAGPFMLAGLLYLGSGLGLLLAAPFRPRDPALRLRRSDLPTLLGSILSG